MIKHFHEFQSKFKDIFRKQQKKPAEEYVSPQDRKREIAVYFLQNWEQFFLPEGFYSKMTYLVTERDIENNLKVKSFCWTVGVF